jgi:hypothetical protein
MQLASAAAPRLSTGMALLAVLLAVAACGPTCGQAAAQPIEGYWSWEDNGVQQIKSTGSGKFEGTIVKKSTTSKCPAAVGRVVLKLDGGGTHYTGQDEWFRNADCARKFTNDTVVDMMKSDSIAHLCSTGPFTDATPVHDCTDLTRLSNFTN